MKDPDAPAGYAGAVRAGRKATSVVFGYYSSVLKKMGDEVKFPVGESSGRSYRLYRLATDMEMLPPHYIYLKG